MQIQGSGKVDLPGRRDIYVHYSDQNGHEFYPIGKELLDIIPLEEMSMQRIKEHLRSLPKDEQDKILAKDPSYVFLKQKRRGPLHPSERKLLIIEQSPLIIVIIIMVYLGF
jgi:membrane-bound lytic murein transglycosylase A